MKLKSTALKGELFLVTTSWRCIQFDIFPHFYGNLMNVFCLRASYFESALNALYYTNKYNTKLCQNIEEKKIWRCIELIKERKYYVKIGATQASKCLYLVDSVKLKPKSVRFPPKRLHLIRLDFNWNYLSHESHRLSGTFSIFDIVTYLNYKITSIWKVLCTQSWNVFCSMKKCKPKHI